MLWSSQWDIFALDSLLKKSRGGKAKAKIIFHSYIVFTLVFLISFCTSYFTSGIISLQSDKLPFAHVTVYICWQWIISVFHICKGLYFAFIFERCFFGYRFQSRKILFLFKHLPAHLIVGVQLLSRVWLICSHMDCDISWVGFSRGSFQPREGTRVFCLAGGFFTTEPSGKPYRLHHFSIEVSHYIELFAYIVYDVFWLFL